MTNDHTTARLYRQAREHAAATPPPYDVNAGLDRLTRWMAERAEPTTQAPIRLSDDEIQLLSLIAQGITAQDAARRLASSATALRQKLRKICTCLQVDTPIQAVVWAADQHLLDAVAVPKPTEQLTPVLSCAETLAALYARRDGELGAEDAAAVARHLDDCTPCLTEYGLEEAITRLVKNYRGSDPVPEIVRAKILTHSEKITAEWPISAQT